MENETTVMKALIVAFIIGLISTMAILVGDYYNDTEVQEETCVDSVEIPVVETNIYKFKQKMIYYGL